MHPFYRWLAALLTVPLLVASFLPSHPASAETGDKPPETKIGVTLAATLDRSTAPVRFVVRLTQQADTLAVARTSRIQTAGAEPRARTTEVRKAVVDSLRRTAADAQANLSAMLDRLKSEGHVESVENLWVVNALVVHGDQVAVQQLAGRPEVASLQVDERVQLVEPPREVDGVTVSGTVPWNLTMVGAPEAWRLGGTGTGVVVGILDTGVDWSHPALTRAFRGFNPANPSQPDASGNWLDVVNGIATPYDDVGHGTHVTGTVVGYDPLSGIRTGVAPNAKWIAVKAFDAEGAYYSWLLRAGQWFLAPTDAGGTPHPDWAPDVINNSWGGGPGFDEFYRAMVQNWRAADIFPVFAAGNDGPETATIGTPANYPESYAVAAVDKAGALAWFSSRGPGPYGGVQKPNSSAPGVSVVSTLPGGLYGSGSGTSMAAPHVTGVVALLRSLEPALTVAQIEQALTSTALPRTSPEYPTSPNDGYGAGLVNAQSAILAVVPLGTVAGRVTEAGTNQPLQATLTLQPLGATTDSSGADGTYSLSAPAGAYTLTASARGHAAVTQPVTLTNRATVTLNLALPALNEGTLTGRVTDRAGSPFAGAVISLDDDPLVATVTTDGTGRYTLSVFEGAHTVRVRATGYDAVVASVTVSPVGATTQDFTLVSLPEGVDDWTQWRGGPAHTGYNNSLMATPLQKLWSFPNQVDANYVKLLVAAGKVFVWSGDDRLYALDAASGAVLWNTLVGSDIDSRQPVYSGGRVIVTNQAGDLTTLDAATGQILWSRLRYTGTDPAVVDGRIYIRKGNVLSVVDLDGTIVWSKEGVPEGTLAVDGTSIVVTDSHSVTAYDRGSGALRWTWQCECSLNYGPTVIAGDRILVREYAYSTGGVLYALDANTGQSLWRLQHTTADPAVWDGAAYVPTWLTPGISMLTRVQLHEGAVTGSLVLGVQDSLNGGAAQPAIANGIVYTGFDRLRAIDARTMQEVWLRSLPFGNYSLIPPVVGDDTLVFLEEGKVTALGPVAHVNGGTMSGTVHGAGGVPIAGAEVRLEPGARITAAAADGWFSVNAPAGAFTAVVRAYGYEELRQDVTITAGATSRYHFALRPAARGAVTGQVLDAATGLPLPGARVKLLEDSRVPEMVTGAQGEYRLEAYAGSYTVQARKSGYFNAKATAVLTAEPETVLTMSLTPVPDRPDDWVTEYGPPEHTGMADSLAAPPLIQSWRTTGWSLKTDTRPVVGNGKVFLSSADGWVRALALTTGQELWSQPRSARSPAYDRNTVYVTDGSLVTAYSADSGDLLWSVTTAGSGSISCALTAFRGQVIVVKDWYQGPTVTSLDGETGKVLWSRALGSGPAWPATAAVSGNRVVVSWRSDETYVFDLKTGRQLWHRSAGGVGGSAPVPVISGDTLFELNPSGILTATDLSTGGSRWTVMGLKGTPTVVDGVIYAANATGTLAIRAADGVALRQLSLQGQLSTGGAYLWGDGVTGYAFATGVTTSPVCTGCTNVIVAEDKVLAVDSSRNLVAYSPSQPVKAGTLSGKVLGNGSADQPLAAQVTVAGRMLSASPVDGAFALRLPAGTYTVTATAAHWNSSSASVTVPASGSATVVLSLTPQPQATVTGRLQDARTGLPLTQGQVSLQEDATVAAFSTGDAADYRLLAYPGAYTLRAQVDGYRTAFVPVTLTPEAPVVRDIYLTAGPAGDCPVSHCDPGGSGRSTDPVRLPLTPAWSNAITPRSQPVIADGKSFLLGGDGKLYAVDLASGRVLWSPDDLYGDSTAPVFAGGRVFVVGSWGYVYAFDARTGLQLWKSTVTASGATSLIEKGGRLFLTTGTTVLALDASTGTLLWKQTAAGKFGSLAVGNGMVYTAAPGPKVYAFAEATGALAWMADGGSSSSQYEGYPVALSGETLLVGPGWYDTQIRAYTTAGVLRWTGPGSAPAISNGVVYTYRSGALTALDPETGTTLWSVPASPPGSSRQPLVTDTAIILGNAAAIDLTMHQVVWTYAGGGGISPVAGEGFVLVTDSFGHLAALRGAPSLQLTVTLEGGAPVNGTTASLAGQGIVTSVELGASGTHTFGPLPGGDYILTITHPSHLRRSMPVTIRGAVELRLVLTPGDLNQDGGINLADLQQLVAHWGSSDAACDLTGDGKVDLRDAAALARHFGTLE
ncbi:MAG TPA: PQQ-binding-like beta-propeller repeat protein [Symbiobacteriaceae bacterium]|jgi:outer membrane protein assembly factor BamB